MTGMSTRLQNNRKKVTLFINKFRFSFQTSFNLYKIWDLLSLNKPPERKCISRRESPSVISEGDSHNEGRVHLSFGWKPVSHNIPPGTTTTDVSRDDILDIYECAYDSAIKENFTLHDNCATQDFLSWKIIFSRKTRAMVSSNSGP